MTRLIRGAPARIDLKRGEAVIGAETFRLLPGLPASPDLIAGVGVFALVSETKASGGSPACG
jgi:hypothetical protein